MVLAEAMQFLVNIGLLDVILPFILVFTISYAILDYTKTLGSKQVNAMASFVFGFFIILATNLLNLINALVSAFVSIILLGLLLSIVFAFAGLQPHRGNRLYAALLFGLFALLGTYAFVRANIIRQQTFNTLLLFEFIIAGIVIIAALLLRKPKHKQEPSKTAPSRTGQDKEPENE